MGNVQGKIAVSDMRFCKELQRSRFRMKTVSTGAGDRARGGSEHSGVVTSMN